MARSTQTEHVIADELRTIAEAAYVPAEDVTRALNIAADVIDQLTWTIAEMEQRPAVLEMLRAGEN